MVQLLRLLDVNPLDILPQRPPFVMIDNLIRYDERIAATRLEVKESTMFVYDGELSAAGMIENMAQTCAARLGYYNLISGLPVKIGYIGAISGLHISRTPKVGEILETEICVEEEVFGVTLVNGKSRIADQTVMEARMKIVIQ